jgi:hypothetical protein
VSFTLARGRQLWSVPNVLAFCFRREKVPGVISPDDRQIALQILQSAHFEPTAANHLIERALEAGGFLDPFRAISPSSNKRFPSLKGSRLAIALEWTDNVPQFGKALIEDFEVLLVAARST